MPHRILDRQERALRVLLPLGLALAIFSPLLLHPTQMIYSPQSDIVFQYLHLKRFPAETLKKDGEIPLWNPYLMSGTPVIGNPQSSLFYPPNWLFFILPAEQLMGWMIAAHIAFGGVGVWLLSRRYSKSVFAGAVSSAIFILSAVTLGHVWAGHFPHLLGVSWIPWVLLALEKAKERPIHAFTLSVSLALMYFTGHVQEWFYTCFIVACLVVARAISLLRKEGRGSSLRWLLLVTAAGALSLGIIAIDLLPTLEVAQWGLRSGGLSFKEASDYSLSPKLLTGLLNAWAWGRVEDRSYFGPYNYWEYTTYVGVVGLFLLFVSFREARKKGFITLAALTLGSVLFSLGSQTPFYWMFWKFVPGFSYFRVPARAHFFFLIGASLLAGMGAETLFGSAPEPRRVKVAKVIATGLLLVLITGLLTTAFLQFKFPEANSRAQVARLKDSAGAVATVVLARTFHSPIFLSISAGTLLVLFLIIAGKIKSSVARAAIFALIVIDLFAYGRGLVGTAPVDKAIPANDVTRFLARRSPAQRVWDEAGWVQDHQAMRFGIRVISGYEATVLKHYAKFVETMVGTGTVTTPDRMIPTWGLSQAALEQRVSERLVDLLNIRYIVTGKIVAKPNWKKVAEFYPPADDGRGYYRIIIYENLGAMGTGFIVHEAEEAISDEEATQKLKSLPVRERAIISGGAPSAAEKLQPKVEGAQDSCTIESEKPGRIRARVELASNGLLIIPEVWMPGWKAKVDGRPRKVIRANVAFQGIFLEAGKHEIEVYYLPTSFIQGAFISLATLAAIVAFLLGRWGLRRPSKIQS